MYETLSETHWNIECVEGGFLPNVFNEIYDFLELKLKAVEAYQSQLKYFPDVRSIEALKSLAIVRGAISGMRAAERSCLSAGSRIKTVGIRFLGGFRLRGCRSFIIVRTGVSHVGQSRGGVCQNVSLGGRRAFGRREQAVNVKLQVANYKNGFGAKRGTSPNWHGACFKRGI